MERLNGFGDEKTVKTTYYYKTFDGTTPYNFLNYLI